MAKRGRPAKPDTKNVGYRIRMNETEMQQLDELQQLCGTSKAEVIRHALSSYHTKIIKQKKKDDKDGY
jgi:hypothetical protein